MSNQILILRSKAIACYLVSATATLPPTPNVAATLRANRKGLKWASYQSKIQKYSKIFI